MNAGRPAKLAKAARRRHLPPMTAQPPLQAAIIPVTAFQQNCTLLWCTRTMKGAFVDPGGNLEKLKAPAAQHGVTLEKILITPGHIDHCGSGGILAEELRSEEHTSDLQSPMRNSYAVFCLKTKKTTHKYK